MDSSLARIAEILPRAAAAMDTAIAALADRDLRKALGAEQRGLQHLQRAEAEFKNVQVSMGGEGGGGGGGGQEPEDLADLFELQEDRMRNQYETVDRGSDEEQQSSAEVDATAERLKQLAARQLQENERARRKADSLGSMGASGSGSGEAQRQLAREAEEAARQLERLARERQSQELAEAARRLDQASDAMRRSAAAGGQQNDQQAREALDRLREAQRLLDREKDNRLERSVENAAESGRRLAEEQQRVQEDVARQAETSGRERAELQQRIDRRKAAMADSAAALASRLDRDALSARRESPSVARELQEAADTLRTRRIEDKIRQTQELVRRQIPQQYQDANERVVADDIEAMNRALEEVRVAARNRQEADTSRRNADALDRARNLVRGVESLAERAQQQREREQASASGNEQQGNRQQGNQQSGQQGNQQSGQPGNQPQGNQGQANQSQGQGNHSQGDRPDGQGEPSASARGGQRGSAGQGGPRIGGAQATRELRERLNDARALRRELSNSDVDLSELDRAIEGMQGLSNRGSLADPRAERELRHEVVEGLRAFEFTLGRALGAQPSERALVERRGEVPPEYRKYVEEYYRALGRVKP